MRIIVEGADGSGKTTVVNYLAEKFNCDVVHMTRWGSRNPFDYISKLYLNNVILDRSFISEVIYKQAFGLTPKISLKEFNDLMKTADDKDWKIIFLTAPTNELEKRLKTRGDEDDEIIKKIEVIDRLYRRYSEVCNIPIFDTTKANYLNDIMEELIK